MAATTKVWTDAELMTLPQDGRKYELIEGEIHVSPTGGWGHGDICALLGSKLFPHVLRKKLGCVFDGQTGWRMKSGNLLSPDVSFLGKARYAGKPKKEGFMHGAPDLAVEVLSPGNTEDEIDKKLNEYFANGSRLAWVIDSKRKIVEVYETPGKSDVLHEGESLSGGDAVPGFSVPISALFEDS